MRSMTPPWRSIWRERLLSDHDRPNLQLRLILRNSYINTAE